MSDIKPGDLVMVIKPTPCCGYDRSLGEVFRAKAVERRPRSRCLHCGSLFVNCLAAQRGPSSWGLTYRLKKIDPPAEGDSLPTRRDLEVEA